LVSRGGGRDWKKLNKQNAGERLRNVRQGGTSDRTNQIAGPGKKLLGGVETPFEGELGGARPDQQWRNFGH